MRTLASIALALALAGCVSLETYNKKSAEANRFRQEWEDEAANRAVLQEKIAATQKQVDALNSELSALREKMQGLVGELSQANKRLEAAKVEVEKELEKKSGEYEQLSAALRGEIEAGRIELTELRGRTTVKMKDKILFASGSATIGADGREALKKVAQALHDMQKAVRVEGHTDNVPTGARRRFPTNWELSSARALAVVRFLQESGVDPTRLSAAGFGEFQPIASNETLDGRSQNRRIEINLTPIEAPVAASPRPAPAAEPSEKLEPSSTKAVEKKALKRKVWKKKDPAVTPAP